MMSSYKKSQLQYRSYAEMVQSQTGARGQLGRETLHLFPAEVNAARFERRLVELNQPPREFHNDVVLQLEDLDRFRLFTRAWAYDVVTRMADEAAGGAFYALKLLPEQTGAFTTQAPQPVTIYLTTPIQGTDPDIFEALKRFNYVGKDARTEHYAVIQYDRVQQALDEARRNRIAAISVKGSQLSPMLEQRFATLAPGDREKVMRRHAEAQFLKQTVDELEGKAKSSGPERTRDINTLFYFVLKDDISTIDVEINDILKAAR
jgi:hypothetical protein